jgi:endonuclease-8
VPEGDALRRAAERLRPLIGLRIEAASPNPRGLVTGVAASVDGRVLEGVEAVGKHLLLRFEGGVTVRSHLRMSGRWRVGPAGAPLVGRPWLVLRAGGVEATQWNGPVLTLDTAPVRRLGPDVMADGFDAAAAASRIRREGPRLLGEALLDQALVAGIGNMWMAEALWHARLSPWLASGEADLAALEEALTWVSDAMREAVRGGRAPRAVYRRAGRPCSRCGTPISSRGLGDDNRTAYWCSVCQRTGAG